MTKDTQSGFTLIELLVVMVITTMIGGAVVGLQYLMSTNQVVVWRNLISVEEANSNLTQMVKELRNARDSENAAYVLETANDQELTFYSDYDFDGTIERVRYFLIGTEFSKGVVEPTGFPAVYNSASEVVKVLSENVQNGLEPVFYYYNGDWPNDTTNNPLAQSVRLANTRLIFVNLRLNTVPDDPDKDYLLQSYTQIRQLKEQL